MTPVRPEGGRKGASSSLVARVMSYDGYAMWNHPTYLVNYSQNLHPTYNYIPIICVLMYRMSCIDLALSSFSGSKRSQRRIVGDVSWISVLHRHVVVVVVIQRVAFEH